MRNLLMMSFAALTWLSPTAQVALAADQTATQVQADKPAEPTKADCDAFLVAARHGRVEQLKELLARGVKPDVPRDHNGNLPLGLAALEGQIDAVKLLIAAGADPKNDIIKYCSYQDDVTVASYLVEKGAGQKKSELIAHDVPLVFYTEKPAFRQLLIEKTATDPNQRHGGQTILINCIKMGMVDCVRALLTKGADPAAAADNGETPLAVAQRLLDKQPALAGIITAALQAKAESKTAGQPQGGTPTPATAANPAPAPANAPAPASQP